MPRPADPNARASLISAARSEFVKKGLRGARIEDITAACGLSKGAFYLHFASKEELFGEVVGAVKGTLEVMAQERLELMERFFAEHGPLDAKEPPERSRLHERLAQLETEQDLRTLEVMWDNRDVMHVLLRGSQGTDFEPVFWALVDREVERIATDFRRMQSTQAFRADVPPALFGTVIIGTYSMLIQQMSRMQEKPDLASWAGDLQQLFREGVMRRDLEPAAMRLPRAVSSRTSPRQASARAHTRKTSRKS
jgi:AcrR family transcriptional regulator